MNIILSAYFNTLIDPQRLVFWKGNDFTIISGFYFSLQRLKLNAVIFHDHLSKEFIDKWQTDRIKFEYYKPEKNVLSARWKCFYQWLSKNENIDKIFCLDISDVIINRDPFWIERKIICGSEDRIIKKDGYIVNCFRDSYGKPLFPDEKVLNCGIVGSQRKIMLKILGQMLIDFNHFDTEKNIDMAVFNKVIYSNFSHQDIKTGHPVHTKFGRNQSDQRCYIKHK